MFNHGRGGWRADDIVRLTRSAVGHHPHASYVCINAGVNNIKETSYPNNADAIEAAYREMVRVVEDAGMIPVLSTIPWLGTTNVKPYNDNHVIPVIKELNPRFYDFAADTPRIDPYAFFSEHQDLIKSDGVHPGPDGKVMWNHLWVDGAGPVVYDGATAVARRENSPGGSASNGAYTVFFGQRLRVPDDGTWRLRVTDLQGRHIAARSCGFPAPDLGILPGTVHLGALRGVISLHSSTRGVHVAGPATMLE